MAEIIAAADLPAAIQAHELVDLMVSGANAKASRVAPCLTWDGAADSETPAPSEEALAEAKLVLIGAIQRWADNASGALTQQQAGPFAQSIDTRQRRGFNLWPSEIEDLQDICKGDDTDAGAFAVDTVADGGFHSPICSLYFGGSECSCGADLTDSYPLYEDV